MLKTAAAASFRLGSEAVAPHRDPPHHFKRLLVLAAVQNYTQVAIENVTPAF